MLKHKNNNKEAKPARALSKYAAATANPKPNAQTQRTKKRPIDKQTFAGFLKGKYQTKKHTFLEQKRLFNCKQLRDTLTTTENKDK